MNGISPSTSRLSAAQDRLSQAIDRLEGVLDKTPSQTSSVHGDEVTAQLQALQDENSELRGLVDVTVERLDTTIAKFKEKLAG